MDELTAPRKLASIVAVDVAGYSRRTEADEAAAIGSVAELKALVSKAASAHGGRVFNTAGDGFMLEFPTASGALAAAEEISIATRTPVRIGVHLGEVSITDSGDLLGHGVNVAARIQQMAAPGAVLASGDVKRAIRGPLGDRLKPQGSVKLDKMSETLPVFALAPAEGGRAKGRRLDLRRPLVAAAAVAVVGVLAVAAWLDRGLWERRPTADPRVAIPPFVVLGKAPGLGDFAQGVRDKILSVMSVNQVRTVSLADSETLRSAGADGAVKRLGVTLLVDGTIEGDGQTLDVRIHLDDPRQHVTLWTTSLRGAANGAVDLQTQLSTKVTNVLLCANGVQRAPSAPTDPDIIALFFSACDLRDGVADLQQTEQALEDLRQVTARAPGFAQGHSMLAAILANGYRYIPGAQGAARYKEALAEAQRALQIDAKDGDAWIALSFLQPVTAYQERERLLVRGLGGAPTNAGLLHRYSDVLAEVGRMKEAVAYAERSAASAPLDPVNSGVKGYLAGATGQFGAARTDLAEDERAWPSAPQTWGFAYFLAMWSGDWPAADALLRRPNQFVPPKNIALLRTCIDALRTRAPARIAAAERAFKLHDAADQITLRHNIQCLAQLGLTDAAFEEAGRFQPDVPAYDGPAIFFFTSTASMRKDRRFMTLAARLGLVDYWRATGKWPDFCAEPGLPYDCKAEAEKAAAAKGN